AVGDPPAARQGGPVRFALALLLAASPLAARAQIPTAPTAPTIPAPPPRTQFLEIEPSFFGQYGLQVIRNGTPVGPGYLAARLSALVQGSPEAVRHATQARTWAGLGFGFGLPGAALAVGSLVVYVEALPSPTDRDIALQFSLLGGSLIAALIATLCSVNVPIE